ncbi:MAG: SDR family NAD(P)-dependent oxidoreductase, partial [Acidimicrobiales bacterium]|nr:SDR family NAD(P)-dependent oxidoreductase [Acidimicrobiales bacterium]
MGKLDGKVAFITGGARGQGRSHAVELAREGCDIAVFDIAEQLAPIPYGLASPDDLAETAKLVEKQGRKCVTFAGDVRSTEAVNQAIKDTVAEL